MFAGKYGEGRIMDDHVSHAFFDRFFIPRKAAPKIKFIKPAVQVIKKGVAVQGQGIYIACYEMLK